MTIMTLCETCARDMRARQDVKFTLKRLRFRTTTEKKPFCECCMMTQQDLSQYTVEKEPGGK